MDDLLSIFIIVSLILMALIGLIKADSFIGIMLSFLLLVFTAYVIVYIY
jgi:hypothetical protein